MFKYYNNNPLSQQEEDCVTRAISLASGYGYYQIKEKLHYVGELLECEELCVCCYKHLLDKVFEYPRLRCAGMTVGEVVEQNPDDILLIRIEGHLTCAKNGEIKDLWDCSNEYVDIVWKII